MNGGYIILAQMANAVGTISLNPSSENLINSSEQNYFELKLLSTTQTQEDPYLVFLTIISLSPTSELSATIGLNTSSYVQKCDHFSTDQLIHDIIR